MMRIRALRMTAAILTILAAVSLPFWLSSPEMLFGDRDEAGSEAEIVDFREQEIQPVSAEARKMKLFDAEVYAYGLYVAVGIVFMMIVFRILGAWTKWKPGTLPSVALFSLIPLILAERFGAARSLHASLSESFRAGGWTALAFAALAGTGWAAAVILCGKRKGQKEN